MGEAMRKRICRCCAFSFVNGSPSNPNICLDCETLAADWPPAALSQTLLDVAANRPGAKMPTRIASSPASLDFCYAA
jgi:hypothetical protein